MQAKIIRYRITIAHFSKNHVLDINQARFRLIFNYAYIFLFSQKKNIATTNRGKNERLWAVSIRLGYSALDSRRHRPFSSFYMYTQLLGVSSCPTVYGYDIPLCSLLLSPHAAPHRALAHLSGYKIAIAQFALVTSSITLFASRKASLSRCRSNSTCIYT